MKWAIVGSRGMLGKDLVAFLCEQGEQVKGFHRGNLDFSLDSKLLHHAFAGFDLVVNCVAYTKVDQAELEREEALFANATIPSILAGISEIVGSKLIHLSTDYVFDGKSEEPYLPEASRNPLSAYGETKAIGEDLVLAFGNTQVVRTSWLYGAQGNCFPKTIARKLLAGASLGVVDDQLGSPTHTKDLARFIFHLGASGAPGSLWHGVSSGSTSWFGFASEVARSLEKLARYGFLIDPEKKLWHSKINPTTTESYSMPAKRPVFSVMKPSLISGYQIPTWLDAWSAAEHLVLREFLEQPGTK